MHAPWECIARAASQTESTESPSAIHQAVHPTHMAATAAVLVVVGIVVIVVRRGVAVTPPTPLPATSTSGIRSIVELPNEALPPESIATRPYK